MPTTRLARLLLLLLLVSTVSRLVFAWIFLGFLTGDDVEILETAFRRVRGLDYQPWEIRNLLLPELLLAPALGLASAVGVDTPATLVRVVIWPFVLLGSLSLWLLYRLTMAWTGDRRSALLAATLYAFHPLFVALSASATPRVPAVTALLAAALLLSRPDRNRLRAASAGALLALAFACRYSEGLFLLPLAAQIWLLTPAGSERRGQTTALLLGFLATTLITVGVADFFSWGEPFASLQAFARYTLIEQRASAAVPQQPLGWYLRRLPAWIPLTLLPLLIFIPRRGEHRVGWGFIVAPLAVLSLIHHKDVRYLQAMVPFLCLLAACGAVQLWRRGARRSTVLLVSISLLLGLRGGVRLLDRKSMAAVVAAREMARDPRVESVVLSQAWAYGHRLFLGNAVGIRDVSTPLDRGELEAALPGADWVGLYVADLKDSPDLEALLQSSGFERRGIRSWRKSKPVALFAAAPQAATDPEAPSLAATGKERTHQ